ncbi:hypothetical protein AAFF_G00193750 [Aldrovandia affinis]|uniref:Uncharacterized protein n=1 Tax=Aldrovandia affinis TaxID=143900 RepID=A0AAD7WUY1_9TELE|nr:hypothetical protein AAFF_G00193750 [Aldrovandia affinis]
MACWAPPLPFQPFSEGLASATSGRHLSSMALRHIKRISGSICVYTLSCCPDIQAKPQCPRPPHSTLVVPCRQCYTWGMDICKVNAIMGIHPSPVSTVLQC